MNTKRQKIVLFSVLESIFGVGSVEKEKRFEWGDIPDNYQEQHQLVFDTLKNARGYDNFVRSKAINYDFFIEGNNPALVNLLPGINTNGLIIEYDEKQHFSQIRKLSLLAYPSDITLYFDKQRWIDKCDEINARDNDPIYRDEQRAFRDSIRDISSYRNNYLLLRIMYSDYDFENNSLEQSIEHIRVLVSQLR